MTEAALALLEREDGKVLVVWNRRLHAWTLPGGKVEFGEGPADALQRELREETNLVAVSWAEVYRAPGIIDPTTSVTVWRVRVRTAPSGNPFADTAGTFPVEGEPGCPVTWFEPSYLIECAPWPDWYREMFTAVALDEGKVFK